MVGGPGFAVHVFFWLSSMPLELVRTSGQVIFDSAMEAVYGEGS
jgi:hypothetical protein